ncbi:MAG: rhodanese-like domain-containing protein [Litorilinea sp.]
MPNPYGAPEISVHDVQRKLDAADTFVFLDVRETDEHNLARIDHAGITCLPLSRLAQEKVAALPVAATEPDAEIVVFCHHGTRSAQVVAWLRQQGWTNVWNMDGGIAAWSEQIDSSVGTY